MGRRGTVVFRVAAARHPRPAVIIVAPLYRWGRPRTLPVTAGTLAPSSGHAAKRSLSHMSKLTDYVVFHDQKLAQKYSTGTPIPM
ncbi:MAG TPA: hypothetical protein VGI70_21525, partial [Polyangiales bacterium]